MRDAPTRLDLEAARQRLDGVHGREYWRCLEELAGSEEFQELVCREFPSQADQLAEPISRRRFLTLMGASLALAGVWGCSPAPAPHERIFPYVHQPEELAPGLPLYFATTLPLAGYASGLLVESHLGRPTKVEGNPDHPASPRPADSPPHAKFGPSSLFAQASILTFYDPDRSQSLRQRGDLSSWEEFQAEMSRRLPRPEQVRLRVLTETVTSPTLASQLWSLLQRFPQAKWHVHEPAGRDNVRDGARLAFGDDVATHYRLARADVILSLDADFLSCGPGHLRYLRDFSERRRIRQGQNPQAMNRLYVVESTPSSTGAVADHRLPLRAGRIETFTRALAARFGILQGEAVETAAGVPAGWLAALAQDLRSHAGKSAVIVGEGQPPLVHALAHALNERLGNNGQTVIHTDPVEARPPGQQGTLAELVHDMAAGRVDILLIVGGNPVYSAPVDLRFGARLQSVGLRIHLGLYFDETAAACHWHIPEAHYLESWGDARAFDGTVSLIQPLIAPLYQGKTASELLAIFTGQPERSAQHIVRAHWRQQSRGGDFEAWWRRALHDGLVRDSHLARRNVSVERGRLTAVAPAAAEGTGLEIVFRPDPTIADGRFANNGWLQELPKPLSKITWENAAYLSAETAVQLGLAPSPERGHEANGRVVVLRYRGREVRAPAWVLPGHADGSVTVHLGYGRTRAGRVGTGLGFDAYLLRTSDAPWFGSGLEVEATADRQLLACTQRHHVMEGRQLVRSGTVADMAAATPRHELPVISLYPDHPYAGNQWGMVIDLGLCTGCSACIVACQSENNIPVVGQEEVIRGREMHWLRVDAYYKGAPGNPETYLQPVPCMQCENAPCEQVCPVGATVHSDDGLNDMIYNRCVGTRYCSNNCPYKVRRFNYFEYANFSSQSLRLMRNPEVTVRSRGVMEKCTYCVQRIRHAEIDANREERAVRDGEVQTACQAACPAGAIIFGNINAGGGPGRAASKVVQLKREPLQYSLLAELNTRPRTSYLPAIRNPNPAITPLQASPVASAPAGS